MLEIIFHYNFTLCVNIIIPFITMATSSLIHLTRSSELGRFSRHLPRSSAPLLQGPARFRKCDFRNIHEASCKDSLCRGVTAVVFRNSLPCCTYAVGPHSLNLIITDILEISQTHRKQNSNLVQACGWPTRICDTLSPSDSSSLLAPFCLWFCTTLILKYFNVDNNLCIPLSWNGNIRE